MEEKINNIEIGQKIREQRKKLKMSREKLAESMELSVNYLGKIERGQTFFSIDTLLKFSKVLGVTPNYLLSYSNNEAEKDRHELIDMIESCSKKQTQFLLEIARSVKTYVNDK